MCCGIDVFFLVSKTFFFIVNYSYFWGVCYFLFIYFEFFYWFIVSQNTIQWRLSWCELVTSAGFLGDYNWVNVWPLETVLSEFISVQAVSDLLQVTGCYIHLQTFGCFHRSPRWREMAWGLMNATRVQPVNRNSHVIFIFPQSRCLILITFITLCTHTLMVS